MDLAGIILVLGTVNTPERDHWASSFTQPVNYGETYRTQFEILTRKGKPSRSWFHIVIYRLESGNYELTTYIA